MISFQSISTFFVTVLIFNTLVSTQAAGGGGGVRGAVHHGPSSYEVGYEIDVYACDENMEQVHSTDQLAFLIDQGSVYKLCFEPNEKARLDGVHINAIGYFDWRRQGRTCEEYAQQVAVWDAKAVESSLLVCDDDYRVKCSLETMLGEAFHHDTHQGQPITGYGTATLTTGDIVALNFQGWNVASTPPTSEKDAVIDT